MKRRVKDVCSVDLIRQRQRDTYMCVDLGCANFLSPLEVFLGKGKKVLGLPLPWAEISKNFQPGFKSDREMKRREGN